jgi:hypothetical protein
VDGFFDENDVEDIEEDGDPSDKFRIRIDSECFFQGNPQFKENQVYRNPHISAVMIPKNAFDEKQQDVVLARIAAAGGHTSVEMGAFAEGAQSTTFTVTRKNPQVSSFVSFFPPSPVPSCAKSIDQFFGTIPQDRKAAVVQAFDQKVQRCFGTHVDASVLNKALQHISPEEEFWTITIELCPPYMLGDATKAFVTGVCSDVLVCLPVKTNMPAQLAKKPKLFNPLQSLDGQTQGDEVDLQLFV